MRNLVMEAHAWYAQQRWLVGANYVPTDAINQLEMWQAEIDQLRALTSGGK